MNSRKIHKIGEVGWTNSDVRASIPEFLEIYKYRPISINEGGMRSPHMFATWFMLRKLRPKIIVESGVWKGQGTWIIEQALPKSQIICFDIDFSELIYKSKKAEYVESDVKYYNWNKFNENEELLFFFDDHQNAFDRIRWSHYNGFKHFIFEDNYP